VLPCSTLIARNYIHGGPEALVTLETHCKARLEWNVIARGGDAGVRMSQGSQAHLEQNTIIGTDMQYNIVTNILYIGGGTQSIIGTIDMPCSHANREC
jgi:hypothetical protein